MEIHFDPSKIPSETGLVLAQSTPQVRELAATLAKALGLGHEDFQMFADCMVGAVAGCIDEYMGWKVEIATDPMDEMLDDADAGIIDGRFLDSGEHGKFGPE